MTVNTVTPMSSGNHAPCTSLVRFAARNSRSTSRRTAPPRATSHSGVRQCRHTTYKNNKVVIVIVPVTAIPKANASAAEVSNANTKVSTEIINAQLIHGT